MTETVITSWDWIFTPPPVPKKKTLIYGKTVKNIRNGPLTKT